MIFLMAMRTANEVRLSKSSHNNSLSSTTVALVIDMVKSILFPVPLMFVCGCYDFVIVCDYHKHITLDLHQQTFQFFTQGFLRVLV